MVLTTLNYILLKFWKISGASFLKISKKSMQCRGVLNQRSSLIQYDLKLKWRNTTEERENSGAKGRTDNEKGTGGKEESKRKEKISKIVDNLFLTNSKEINSAHLYTSIVSWLDINKN